MCIVPFVSYDVFLTFYGYDDDLSIYIPNGSCHLPSAALAHKKSHSTEPRAVLLHLHPKRRV